MYDYQSSLSELQIKHIFFFNDTATTEIYTLSLHDALPIYRRPGPARGHRHPQPPRLGLRPVGRGGRTRRAAGPRRPPVTKRTRLYTTIPHIFYTPSFLIKILIMLPALSSSPIISMNTCCLI